MIELPDNLLEIESQVYGFAVLLFSQMMFTQEYLVEEDKEFDRIKPVIKKLQNALSEEKRKEGYRKAILHPGYLKPLIYTGIEDFWFYIYAISNYRIHYVEMSKDKDFKNQKDEELFYFAIQNVVVKSHKIHRQFNQRFV